MAIKPQGKPMDIQDLSLSTPQQKQMQSMAKEIGAGIYHTEFREGYAQYDPAPCEKHIEGDNNAHIILGRDRPYSFGSGKGAFGGKAGRIHLIAGLASASDLKDGAETGPNLITDAATVYISQRTSIDEYFGIPSGTNMSADDKSGIGIKADHVRIIGREHVKIYAGSAMNIAKPNKPLRNILGLNRERNSKGGDITARGRIDLIADDYEDIQQAVKGNNLVEYLNVLQEQITYALASIDEINVRAVKLNNALLISVPRIALNWQIYSSTPGGFKTKVNNRIESINMVVDEINSVSNFVIPGAESILSDSVYIT